MRWEESRGEERGLFGRRFANNFNLPTKNVALSIKLFGCTGTLIVLIVTLFVSIPGLPPSEFGERRCVCDPFLLLPFLEASH